MFSKYCFILPMQVRDYECDIEGIVNNANYLHYLEHTRHQFILGKGISFSKLHEEGIDMVVARINISYKTPLRSEDEFMSCLNFRKEGIRYVFEQDIFRLPDNKLAARAEVHIVSIVNGKLTDCPELFKMLID
jgi:acyl-CoA thioester hydrolase